MSLPFDTTASSIPDYFGFEETKVFLLLILGIFRLQRNLNNAFAYDLVPAPSVIVAALRAARRVNDFPTAVRIFEGTDRFFIRFLDSASSFVLVFDYRKAPHADFLCKQESRQKSKTRCSMRSM